MKNYYKILEVKPDAGLKDIRAAYLHLSKMYHPDLHQQDKDFEDFFKEIQEAYEVLKNPVKREEYDQQLRLFMRLQTSGGRAVFYIQNKLEKLKKRNGKGNVDYRPYYQSGEPLKNIWRMAALLLFAALAVTLVFLAEKEFSERSLNNIQLTYKTEPAEPEPMIVPEWEIPEIPSLRPEELKKEEKTGEEQQEKDLPAEPETKPENPAKELKKTENDNRFETRSETASLNKPKPAEKIEQNTAAENKSSNPDPGTKTADPAPAEKTAAEGDKIYIETDKLPQFGGGSPAFVQYLEKNLQYPSDAREKGITGRVLITFVVEKNGEISNVSVVQGIGNGCDEEAMRVMKNAPAWIPGEEKGEKVRVQCTIPITFALH